MTHSKVLDRYGILIWVPPFLLSLIIFTLTLSSIFLNPPESIRKPLTRRIQKNSFIFPGSNPNLEYIFAYKCLTPSIMAFPDIEKGVSSILVKRSVRKRIEEQKYFWENETPRLHQKSLFYITEFFPEPVSLSSALYPWKNIRAIQPNQKKSQVNFPFISSSNGKTFPLNIKDNDLYEKINNGKIKYLTEISVIAPESDLLPRIMIMNSCGNPEFDLLAVQNIFSEFYKLREQISLKTGDSYTLYIHWKKGLENARTEFY